MSDAYDKDSVLGSDSDSSSASSVALPRKKAAYNNNSDSEDSNVSSKHDDFSPPAKEESCDVIYNRLRATRDESVRKKKEDREMQERDDREYREWAWDDKLKRGLQELDEKEAAEDAAHAKEYPDFVSAAVVEDGGECDDIANDNNAIELIIIALAMGEGLS